MEGPGVVELKGQNEEVKGDVKGMLEKGLSLGKKVVITGVMVSSAALLLPSILIISALGFAFSIPFGVMFLSYACTQKLMNRLLPLSGQSTVEREMPSGHEDKEGEVGAKTLANREDNEAVESDQRMVNREEDAGELKGLEGEGKEQESETALGSQDVDIEGGEKKETEDVGETKEKRSESAENEKEDNVKRVDHEDENGEVKTGTDEVEGKDMDRGATTDVKIEGEGEGRDDEKGPTEEEPSLEEDYQENKGDAGDASSKKKKTKKKKSNAGEGKEENTSSVGVEANGKPS